MIAYTSQPEIFDIFVTVRVAQPGRVGLREPTADCGRWSPQCFAGIQYCGRS